MSYMYANAPPPHTPIRPVLKCMDACNSSVDNPNAKAPARVHFCLGGVDTVSIIIMLESSSEILEDLVVFQLGKATITPVSLSL